MSERPLRPSLALTAIVAACAGEAPPPAAAPDTPAEEVAPRERWPRFSEVAGWPAVNASAFPTRGHLVRPSHALVRVSPESRDRYLGLVTDSVFDDGAVIAMFHQSPDSAQGGSVYVMEKKDGEWSFLALDSDGGILTENLNVCALCHRGGVADQVFGLPRNLTPAAR